MRTLFNPTFAQAVPLKVARKLPAHWPFGVPAETSSDSGEDSGGDGPRTSVTIKQADVAQSAVDALIEADQLNRVHSFLTRARTGSAPTEQAKIKGLFASGASVDSVGNWGEGVERHDGNEVNNIARTGIYPVEGGGALDKSEKGGGDGSEGGKARGLGDRVKAGVFRYGQEKTGVLKTDVGDHVQEETRIDFGDDDHPSVDSNGPLGGKKSNVEQVVEVVRSEVGGVRGGSRVHSHDEAKVKLDLALV